MYEIVQIYKGYAPERGGVPSYLRVLSEELKKYNRVTVLVPGARWRKIEQTNGNLRVIRLPRLMELRSTAFCPALPWELSRLRPEIVHLHFPDPMAHLAYWLSRVKSKLVLSWHGDITRQTFLLRFYRQFLYRILERADAIVVGSPAFRDGSSFLENVRDRCTVIPYGIDLADYELTENVQRRANELSTLHGDRMVLFVGRLVHYKGLEYLIAAMQGLDARLVIIGSGKLRQRLEGQARDPGLRGRIQFFGEASAADLVAHLHACALLVLPSINRGESFGLVQLEAMACRKPVVSTDLPTGVPWVNQHGRTGFVVSPRDVGALRRAIRQLLDDESLRQTFGTAGRRRVESEFTKELHGWRMQELYDSLLTERIHRRESESDRFAKGLAR